MNDPTNEPSDDRRVEPDPSDEHSRSAVDPQPDDPYREPENSTTDDWFGQSVDRDLDLADQLIEQAGGDVEEAAERYDDQSVGAEQQRQRHDG